MAKHVPARLPPMGVPVEVDRRPAASDDVQNVVSSVSSSDQSSVSVDNASGVVRETVVEEDIKRRITTREYVAPPSLSNSVPRLSYSRPDGAYPAGRPYVVPKDNQQHPSQLPALQRKVCDLNSRDKKLPALTRTPPPVVVGGAVMVLVLILFLAKWMMTDSPVAAIVILFVGCIAAAALIAGSYNASRP